MSWEPLGYMSFSTIEAISVYCLIMSLFRFKFQNYLWQALFMVLLINLQSYIMRNEFSLSYLVPLITILLYAFFFKVVVKIPLIWSVVVTVLGYVAYAFLQTGLAKLLFGSISAAQGDISNGYLLQFASGFITILLSIWLYKIGWGFKFDFERLRFKFEDVLMILLIAIFLVFVSVVFYYNDLFVNILFFAAVMIFLLYYAVRKEAEEDID
ncbi:hypothetical protein [Paenibacillus sp. P46E]|uniref:hypothetical protein n=1 Tax=Paenibacillus sp. P46E TaxID=1349436 RepID=UPI00093DA7C0|nr:hypothetical protein [Paenibacillus sp. P46E]OKP97761.1 hypothetical protein A3849_13730 [Paenibacillus sp. P46E]